MTLLVTLRTHARTSTVLAFVTENNGRLDGVHPHLHIWIQIQTLIPMRKNAPFWAIMFLIINLIISDTAIWNNALSMLIASMINLLYFPCNFIHATSFVIACIRITRGSCHLHLANRAPPVVILFHLCNYRALRISLYLPG